MKNIIINLNNRSTGIVNDNEIEKVLSSDWNVSYSKKVIFEDSINSIEGCQYYDKFFDIDIKIDEFEEENLINLIEELSEAGANGSIKIDCYGEQYLNDYLDNIK